MYHFMKVNLIINEKANQDLLQIKWYIAQDSKFYANKTVNEINKRENIRQIIYKSYKILYKFDSKNIYILHIIHHSRNILNLKF